MATTTFGDVTSYLSEAGMRIFNKLNQKMLVLHHKLQNELEIMAQAPTDLYLRAKKSVDYHKKLLEEHDAVLERRLAAVRAESDRQRIEKENNLKTAEENFELQKQKKPRSVLRVEQEIRELVVKMKNELSLPESYYEKFQTATIEQPQNVMVSLSPQTTTEEQQEIPPEVKESIKSERQRLIDELLYYKNDAEVGPWMDLEDLRAAIRSAKRGADMKNIWN